MAERNIRHVEDVFNGRVNGVAPNKQHNILDRKSSFNMFKNKQAPRPPSDQMPLPKIGNYQPKMLLQKTPGDGEHDRKDNIHQVQVHHTSNGVSAPPLIIGDKDVPLRIENDTVDIRDDQPIPAPRRKRRAPNAPETEIIHSEPSTSNPLFGRSMSQRSDEERFEMDLEEQGGDIDFSNGLDNPGFHSRERKISGVSRERTDSEYSWAEEQHQRIQNEHQNNKNGITYPYIPPPDYEDEEMTMEFEDDYEPMVDYERNNAKVYRELEGDDFGKYIQEDDYEFDAPNRPLRHPPPPGSQGGHFMQNRPRHVQKPLKSNKNIDKKMTKSKKKHAPSEPNMKRNTIRDFTFSDSKIGWGDRTTKSTSAKGRYIKHNKDRMRIDNAETFGQKDTKGSYEEFLRVKNGIPLESPNSSDSGVDTGEERHHMNMYQHSQPKQMRNGKYENKQSMWQRLTWRFRKPPPAHIIQSERL
ncbi:uncharacterized protein LOC132751222 [Ruditapes philippinarum]|uniref:uncharacterized protein LOC132751222 n=1 Tax=Ruditapes philippinarum TaxID=129788 RepID=UPI00295AF8D8|nr:uncharacterized protein LOC132751222 [Ruditapes philippinarum]XP_060597355.1 uncharacterized protein LOC132751222 [Ruditapes philippinarum]XP_060597356.1 uncharacterized protein LOC132751222 [Ruditapes philippinarum]